MTTPDEKRQNREADEKNKAETAAVAIDARPETIAGRKVQIREKIAAHVLTVPTGKLLLNWNFRVQEGLPFLKTLYPYALATAYGCEVETVCEVIIDMVENNEIALNGNIAMTVLTAPILAEHCKTWLENKNHKPYPKKSECRCSIVSALTGGGKAYTVEQACKELAIAELTVV